MARTSSTLLSLVVSTLSLACGGNAPAAPAADKAAEATPAKAAEPAPDPAAADAPTAAAAGPATQPDDTIPIAPPPDPLPPAPTPEELKMLDMNPDDLSPEDRRKRASIRYRHIMQDPESPAARAIRQAQAQMMSQVPPNPLGGGPAKDTGLTLHAPQKRYPTPEEREAKLKKEAEQKAKAGAKASPPKDGG